MELVNLVLLSLFKVIRSQVFIRAAIPAIIVMNGVADVIARNGMRLVISIL